MEECSMNCLYNVDLTGDGRPTGFIYIHMNLFYTVDNSSFDLRNECEIKVDGERVSADMLFSTGDGKIVKPGEEYVFYFARHGGLKPGDHKIDLTAPSFSISLFRKLPAELSPVFFDNALYGHNPHDKPVVPKVKIDRPQKKWIHAGNIVDLVNHLTMHSEKHRSAADLFSAMPFVRQFLEDHMPEIYNYNLWRTPFGRYHLILPSELAVKFDFLEVDNGPAPGCWSYYVTLDVTGTAGSDVSRYYTSSLPFYHLIRRWEINLPDLLAGKHIRDQFISCGCGSADCRGENWALEAKDGHIWWIVSNYFQSEKAAVYVYYMPFSMFLDAWTDYFTRALAFFTKYVVEIDTNRLPFHHLAKGYEGILDDSCPRYKDEVKRDVQGFLLRMKELLDKMNAARGTRIEFRGNLTYPEDRLAL